MVDWIQTVTTFPGIIPAIIAVIAIAVMVICALARVDHWAVYVIGIIVVIVCVAVICLQGYGIMQLWPFEWYGLNGAAEPPVIA